MDKNYFLVSLAGMLGAGNYRQTDGPSVQTAALKRL